MNLATLAGNGPLKRQLCGQSDRRGLSHAYIVSGPPGSGRRTLAGLLAAAMVCAHPGQGAPCLSCPPCRKVVGGIHPDLLRVGDDGKDITVAQVRAFRSDAYIRPNEGLRKVYLLENAHTMNASAQNAMLKLLEDGPAYAAFLLVTDNVGALLSTVRSRCELLCLTPVSVEEAEGYLHTRYPDRPASVLGDAALRCEGLLGRAVALLEGGEVDGEISTSAEELLRRFAGRDELALHAYCVGLEKWDRDKFSTLLDAFVLLLRHALVCTTGPLEEHDPARRRVAEEASKALSPKVLLRAVTTAEHLRDACSFHVGAGHLAGWLCAALST